MDYCSQLPGEESRQGACKIPSAESGARTCPECGVNGRQVDVITLKALLTPSALRRLTQDKYLFCSAAGCDVVYFGDDSVFRTADVTVPVWQKSSDPTDMVCYCFEHSDDSIRGELTATGKTNAINEIKQLVKAGKCACEIRNPQGTCCLGNVSTVVKRIQTERDTAEKPIVA